MSPPFSHHVNVLSKPTLAMAPTLKSRRGFEFAIAELEHLLKAVEEAISIGNPDWE
jgi:hypothetical protein